MGSGTRLKIYELMAQGKAVVSTTLGAEGLHYRDGENILIADAPELFADRVVSVLRDEAYRRRLGTAAREFVVTNCSWKRVADQFASLCADAQILSE